MHRVLNGFAILLIWLSAASVTAKALAPEDVPAPLRPWIEWVLHGNEDRRCPFVYTDATQRRCVWPTVLTLNLHNRQGQFTQTWQVYRDSWVSLPGSVQHWPQAVRINDEPALVSERQGRPAIHLTPGTHRVQGTFLWEQLPESLSIPDNTGLVTVTINDNPVVFPDLDNHGQLWLRDRDAGRRDRDTAEDRLTIQVFRKIVDDIPLRVVTLIDLQVAGAQREMVLGRALLPDHVPLVLRSRLPARLEPDGQLRIQVRPGHWTLRLTSRHPKNLTRIPLPKSIAPWPQREVWVFEAHTDIRLVEVEGLPAIDPRQTILPEAWQRLPTFRINAGQAMELSVIRRGDSDPEPDKLTLQRDLWLDFNGQGYSVQDQITGSIARSWRLVASPSLDLGRVVIAGQPQFITTLPGDDRKGVEVRRGTLQLTADSRYMAAIGRLPVVGWEHDFQRVAARLHLPPGWKLFTASGTDNVPNTWLQRWSLWDLFVLLITALAVGRLWHWHWGALTLLTLALIWHEPTFPPRIVWLNILVAVALLRVLPEGRLYQAVRWYRNLALLALVMIAIPFMVMEVRNALFPQLERPWQTPMSIFETAPIAQDRIGPASAPIREEKAPVARQQVFEEQRARTSSLDQALVQELVDPKAQVQTGPGLPRWRWQTVQLTWNGPVAKDQTVRLMLVPPVINMGLNFLRVVLVLVLGLLMLGSRYGPSPDRQRVVPLAAIMVVLPMVVLTPAPSRADIPSPALLEQLKTRLLEPPACLPVCAQVPRMRLDVNPHHLQTHLDIHAQAHVAVPLPAHTRHWLPTRISVDGQPPAGLYRSPTGELWLQLSPGRHQVLLAGPLPPRASFDMPLPLRPHRVDHQATGWTVDGVHENGVPDAQLYIARIRTVQNESVLSALEPSTLPPFVRVERTLRLGLDWQVDTHIMRASPQGSAVVAAIPLLNGESVITEGVRIENGNVLVNMSPQQESFAWQSTLEKRAVLTLGVSDTTAWTEIWRADVNPIWHMHIEGIPVVHRQDRQGRWLPEWRPWPGEEVRLTITRPVGVTGQTLTVDHASLSVQPGRRATDVSVQFALRSSQGGQHTVMLPEAAQLQAVRIDNIAQPVRQEGRQVTLPVHPGAQQFALTWRHPTGIETRFITPAVDLGVPSVNSRLNLQLGRDRWVLWTWGPRLGPAVLFWGVLIIVTVVAVVLGRVPLTPLNAWQWFLLGIGLSQIPLWMSVVVVGWLLALGARAQWDGALKPLAFNAIQLGLAVLTLAALLLLFNAIQHGLLGLPQMQVTGNGSSAYDLNWYQDRSGPQLLQGGVLSVPLVVYHWLMLAWALWLALALLGWLCWGWQCYAAHGLWRPLTQPTPETE